MRSPFGKTQAVLVSALAFSLAAPLSLTGCKRSGDVVVGAFLPMSGADSSFGKDAREGMDLATEEINASGGIKGRKVRLVVEDDASTQAETSWKVRKLIEQDHALGLLGEIASSRTIAGGEIATHRGIPLIAPSSTAEEVTKDNFVFRACFTDAQQGDVAARFAHDSLRKSKVAILFAEDDSYSRGLATTFRDRFTQLGGTVVAEKGYRKSENSFAPYLAELKSKGPELYFVPVYYNVMVQIARQAKAIKIPSDSFLGGDGWDSNVLAEQAGAELEGSHFTNHYAFDVPGETGQHFRTAFVEKYGHEPPSLAAQGYDAARLMFDAIGRAKEAKPEAVRDAIADTTNFAGASGVLTIDSNRNANKPVVVVQIRNKKFTYATQLLSQ